MTVAGSPRHHHPPYRINGAQAPAKSPAPVHMTSWAREAGDGSVTTGNNFLVNDLPKEKQLRLVPLIQQFLNSLEGKELCRISANTSGCEAGIKEGMKERRRTPPAA